MKITRLQIKGLYQFKDIDLDLTYPRGHVKEGLPLDKICLIGQSGTGKTNLLEIIMQISLIIPEERVSKYKPFKFDVNNGYVISEFVGKNNLKAVIKIDQFGYSISGISANSGSSFIDEVLSRERPHLYYFPTTVHSAYFDINVNSRHSEAEYRYHNREISNERNIQRQDENIVELKRQQYYIFDSHNLNTLWDQIRGKILFYRQEEANFRIALTHEAESNDIDIKTSIKKWKEENLNPLERIGKDGLNDILTIFHLRIKDKIEKTNEIKTIQIESVHQGKTIEFEKLSSGTKLIILTALPLFLEKPIESIILMDEPENSLYPDIQRKIINFYSSFGVDNQLYFATHSPIIASSFEPWEILELKFNDLEDSVKQEYYYDPKQERHVKNYKNDPRYLTWDSILRKVFDLDSEGNSAFRIPKLMELASIEEKLSILARDKENNKEVIKQLYNEYKQIIELLDWNTGNEKN